MNSLCTKRPPHMGSAGPFSAIHINLLCVAHHTATGTRKHDRRPSSLRATGTRINSHASGVHTDMLQSHGRATVCSMQAVMRSYGLSHPAGCWMRSVWRVVPIPGAMLAPARVGTPCLCGFTQRPRRGGVCSGPGRCSPARLLSLLHSLTPGRMVILVLGRMR